MKVSAHSPQGPCSRIVLLSIARWQRVQECLQINPRDDRARAVFPRVQLLIANCFVKRGLPNRRSRRSFLDGKGELFRCRWDHQRLAFGHPHWLRFTRRRSQRPGDSGRASSTSNNQLDDRAGSGFDKIQAGTETFKIASDATFFGSPSRESGAQRKITDGHTDTIAALVSCTWWPQPRTQLLETRRAVTEIHRSGRRVR